jgi:hypothetical protein
MPNDKKVRVVVKSGWKREYANIARVIIDPNQILRLVRHDHKRGGETIIAQFLPDSYAGWDYIE